MLLPLRRSLLMPGALGVVVAAVSSFVPLSYDEGNWLAVVRRMALGESLYEGITDNKTPLMFGLVRVLDALPGPYTLARGIWLGVAASIIAAACRSLVVRSGWDSRRATLLGLAFGVAASTQAVFTVNFELPAAMLLILGLTSIAAGRSFDGGVLAALAGAFDLRAIALVPGVVVFAYVRGGSSQGRRTLVAAGVLTIAWAAVVFLVPDLRYSLIELNAATRGGLPAWRPAEQLYALFRGTLIPIGALAALGSRPSDPRTRAAGLALVVPGIAVALASLRPFDKYWTLLLPGLVLLAASVPPVKREARLAVRGFGVAIAALGLVVAVVHAVSTNLDQSRLVSRYERAAEALDASLRGGEEFVRFDTQPFLGVFLPERDRLPAAVLDFLIAETSRQDENHARVEEAIAAATVLADDGALSVREGSVLPQYRPLWRVFVQHLEDFPCTRRIEGLTFRYRASACPPDARAG